MVVCRGTTDGGGYRPVLQSGLAEMRVPAGDGRRAEGSRLSREAGEAREKAVNAMIRGLDSILETGELGEEAALGGPHLEMRDCRCQCGRQGAGLWMRDQGELRCVLGLPHADGE